MGDPQAFALRYYEQGADELLYVDVVASLYGRNSLQDTIKRAAQDIFVPLTVAGGVLLISSVQKLVTLVRHGAMQFKTMALLLQKIQTFGN